MNAPLSFTLQSPAKLNLMLGITPHIIAGKHLLTTLFTTITLADVITFIFDDRAKRLVTLELVTAPGIEPLTLATEQNIAYKAVTELEKITGKKLQGHLHIHIDKFIPHEAGLAGGSSNAAATLKALARLWGLEPLSEPMLAAAQNLGADVTFFLQGGCALMGGSGEKLLKTVPKPLLDVVLVRPKRGVSTQEAYAAFDANPQPLPEFESLVALLESGHATPSDIAGKLANNLAPAAETLLPEIKTLTDELSADLGVCKAMLAGSGSTVFAVCSNAQTSARIAREYMLKGYWAQACTT